MTSTTVRIKEETHRTLRELAAEAGEPMQDLVAKAVESYWRQRFWKRVNAAYEAIWNDPVATKEELEERALWEVTLSDGLEED